MKRDQTETSVGLIKRKKEGHVVEQYTDHIYGKVDPDFKLDQKKLDGAKKKPLNFLESEVERHTKA